jgi:hypothetical protein
MASDEKRGNPIMQEAQNKRPLMKKEASPKRNGLKIKDLDEKRGNPKMQ